MVEEDKQRWGRWRSFNRDGGGGDQSTYMVEVKINRYGGDGDQSTDMVEVGWRSINRYGGGGDQSTDMVEVEISRYGGDGDQQIWWRWRSINRCGGSGDQQICWRWRSINRDGGQWDLQKTLLMTRPQGFQICCGLWTSCFWSDSSLLPVQFLITVERNIIYELEVSKGGKNNNPPLLTSNS